MFVCIVKCFHYFHFQIYEFINELAINYPQLVTISNAGLSYEGNLMPVVKISTGVSGKNAIFAEAGKWCQFFKLVALSKFENQNRKSRS